MVYIPEHAVPQVYKSYDKYSWKPDEDNTALDYNAMNNFSLVIDQVKQSQDTLASESLLAWDPVTQKAVWKVTDGAPDGGALSTPELVFQGTRTGYLKVYDARSGKKLKEIFTGTGIMAAPCTYSIDGVQYIAVMAGYGGAPTCCYPADAVFHEYENVGRLIVFKIGGGMTPLPPKRNHEQRPALPDIKIKEELIAKGSALYYQYCETCHGIGADGRHSLHPDLSMLPATKHQLFRDIVLGGVLAKNGMASFSNSLTEADVEAIQHYVLKKQSELYNQ